jgi:hypothetical protein
MANKIRILIVASLLMLSALATASTIGYAYHDDLQKNVPTSIPVGFWDFYAGLPFENLDEEVQYAFMSFYGVTTLQDLYANTQFQALMDAVSKTTNTTGTYTGNGYTLNNIDLNGVLWTVNGVYIAANSNISLGFLRQIDRTTNASNAPLHSVLPPSISNPLPYPDYDFFTAYDVKNSVTNNTFGFRLDNRVIMTTKNPIANLRSVSFYAILGLRLNSTELLSNRPFQIQISPTGAEGTFTNVGTIQTSTSLPTGQDIFNPTTPISTAFPLYTFTLTALQISSMPANGYYIRFIFDGGVSGSGSKATRSRLVVDDFRINIA